MLIVEDNADMRRLLSFLVGQEFRVRVAPNGREGLEMVRELAPDLVLTDVMMPEMSGTELCRAIKGEPRDAGDSGGARDVEGRARDEDRGARARGRRLRDEALPPAGAAGAGSVAGEAARLQEQLEVQNAAARRAPTKSSRRRSRS